MAAFRRGLTGLDGCGQHGPDAILLQNIGVLGSVGVAQVQAAHGFGLGDHATYVLDHQFGLLGCRSCHV